ncbi:glucoamylase family protein [Fulvivirga sp.]|uniref:glucoamylase family protein n=1 Tax=Fulvivirga sp. TaxID=1931237 RepID=UPI0032EC480D
MNKFKFFFLVVIGLSCTKDNEPEVASGILQLVSARVGTINLVESETIEDMPIDKGLLMSFSLPLDPSSAESSIVLTNESEEEILLNFAYLDNGKTISATPDVALINDVKYLLHIGEIKSTTNEIFPGADFQFRTVKGKIELTAISIVGKNLNTAARVQNIPTSFSIEAQFSEALSPDEDFSSFIRAGSLNLAFELTDDNKTLLISNTDEATHLKRYTLSIDEDLKSAQGFIFKGFEKDFYTQLDSTYKFPEISDEELLTKVQEQTFKYFWDFGHPSSGLARERNTSGEIVTIGGSGFGIMAILVGIERGFITRQEGIDRVETIVDFLETADRFHGVWPHWMNGTSGQTIPFSADDDGADLVETAFMIQGLLAVRQYLNDANVQEAAIIDKITTLWETVEWDWFVQEGDNALTWHWSPNFGFQKNHKIQGWNEALIIYVLAAASPTHPIAANVYHEGWARNGAMVNGNDFYNINLPLGSDRGGPLFFAHYSFLGLDPRSLEDQYANYWEQNVNHSLINRAYCVANPSNFVGYSTGSWGLTASDNDNGYSAHSPNNDLGVITPTAAISSIPYTPEESMEAIRYFYYLLGDKLWGDYGFYDAYNLTAGWYASSYLAIDQGPIIVMIENHRTALLWDLFMKDPEVTAGLDKLGFIY